MTDHVAPKVKPCASLRAVSHAYVHGGVRIRVLDAIDLDIKDAELLAIVGPSGCGKSTLLKLIGRLLKPTSGEVVLDNDRLGTAVAYVPQEPLLLPWRTLLQNITLGLEITEGVTQGHLEAIDGMIKTYGLTGFEDYYPKELSGGMQQRVALIRAFQRKPRLLLCDEPFSAIDFVNRLKLATHFRFQCKILNVTTIFVTHNIEEAIFLGDRVIVMRGRPGADEPGRIHAVHQISSALEGRADAVDIRLDPRFGEYFRQIWDDLGL